LSPHSLCSPLVRLCVGGRKFKGGEKNKLVQKIVSPDSLSVKKDLYLSSKVDKEALQGILKLERVDGWKVFGSIILVSGSAQSSELKDGGEKDHIFAWSAEERDAIKAAQCLLPHLLVIHRYEDGRMAIPGGSLNDTDNSIVEAINREFREETGVAALFDGSPVFTVEDCFRLTIESIRDRVFVSFVFRKVIDVLVGPIPSSPTATRFYESFPSRESTDEIIGLSLIPCYIERFNPRGRNCGLGHVLSFGVSEAFRFVNRTSCLSLLFDFLSENDKIALAEFPELVEAVRLEQRHHSK
jgi:8-oxo-dGTP pyrophosphatase MutT (NUDIX family)